jgi:hypothetical protein
MTAFAELDEHNSVLRVIVVADQEVHDKDGNHDESLGIAFCRRLFGVNTKWVESSDEGKFRARSAGKGYTYDPVLDVFIRPKPYGSWLLNPSTTEWEAPVPEPALTPEQIAARDRYNWDENSLSWVLRSTLPENSV